MTDDPKILVSLGILEERTKEMANTVRLIAAKQTVDSERITVLDKDNKDAKLVLDRMEANFEASGQRLTTVEKNLVQLSADVAATNERTITFKWVRSVVVPATSSVITAIIIAYILSR